MADEGEASEKFVPPPQHEGFTPVTSASAMDSLQELPGHIQSFSGEIDGNIVTTVCVHAPNRKPWKIAHAFEIGSCRS